LLGAFILEAEKIDLEYQSMLIPSSIYSATRSDLYNELQSNKCLNNTFTNPLDAQEKLTYLWHYYQTKKSEVSESKEIKGSTSIDAEFQPVVDHLLQQVPHLKVVLSERPSLHSIMKNLQTLPQVYEANCFKTRASVVSRLT